LPYTPLFRSVELTVGRVAVEVLEQDLELPREQHTFDLDPGAGRHVSAPVVLLATRDIARGARPPPRLARRPRARELGAVLGRPRFEARRLLVEEVAAAAVQPE